MIKRAVITGMGIISPLGSTVKSAFERLHTLKNCVSYQPELENYKGLNSKLAARVSGFKIPADFNRKVTRTMGKGALMAVISAKDALIDAGLLDDGIISSGKTGVSCGSSSGSLEALMDFYSMCVNNETKQLNSGSYVRMMPHTAAVNISMYFKTRGRLISSSTACTSGSMGIGYAYEAVKHGIQDVMIAGGTDEYSPAQIGVFDTLFASSIKNDTPELTPAPFDRNRDGLVIGEGAGMVVIEEYEHAKARGAHIYAEIAGFALNTDGAHITNPDEGMMAEVMRLALKDAGIKAEDIGCINAHGTGTITGDAAESKASEAVFGRKTPISTIKSYTGHTLGAAGAIETVLSIEMMNNKWFCPNLNLKNPDENCGNLDYIMNKPRAVDTEYIITNNFAFGGINTALILKRV